MKTRIGTLLVLFPLLLAFPQLLKSQTSNTASSEVDNFDDQGGLLESASHLTWPTERLSEAQAPTGTNWIAQILKRQKTWLQQSNSLPAITHVESRPLPDDSKPTQVDGRLTPEDTNDDKVMDTASFGGMKNKNQQQQLQQTNTSATPFDFKNAAVCVVWLDNFYGSPSMLPADVLSMKLEAIKFRLAGQEYSYSGHYAVMLNTPRHHSKPYLGFGSPDKAKLLILEDVAGNIFPLQDVTIWDKASGFIDVEASGREWIYSGPYTIQN